MPEATKLPIKTETKTPRATSVQWTKLPKTAEAQKSEKTISVKAA